MPGGDPGGRLPDGGAQFPRVEDLHLGAEGEHVVAGPEDWAEAWMRVDSADIAVLDVLALGTEVEVLRPPDLRTAVREAAARIAARHTGPAGGQ